MDGIPGPLEVRGRMEDRWIECAVCGRRELFKPLVFDDWVSVQVGWYFYPVCPAEQPPLGIKGAVLEAAVRRCYDVIAAKVGRYN